MYADFLHQLIGLWRLERQVIATAGALIARMDGAASFAPLESEASRYHEEGELTMVEGTLPSILFSRSYVYRAEPNGLAIFFDESPSRLFQRFALTAIENTWEGTAVYPCAPDTYCSWYRFELPHGFATTHKVEGPRKAYTVLTRYQRSR